MKSAIIIEDDFIIRLFMGKELQKSGYEVVASLDRGEDLAKNVEKYRPDLILVDVELNGDLDGIDAVSGIDIEHRPELVFVTGSALEHVRERTEPLRPLAILSKPFDLKKFNEAVTPESR
ncbi:response regulator [Balneolales bacterium ANBcel1]|nr:response regulator [Balneolales bacterium ANBcel1]